MPEAERGTEGLRKTDVREGLGGDLAGLPGRHRRSPKLVYLLQKVLRQRTTVQAFAVGRVALLGADEHEPRVLLDQPPQGLHATSLPGV